MLLLTVNTGSSSVRLAVFEINAHCVKALSRHCLANSDRPHEQLQTFLREDGLVDVELIAHRVVHGGNALRRPCLIDPHVEHEIERLAALAPLHNPRALEWIRECRAIFGANARQLALFDTAFYADLPMVAATYALPAPLAEKHDLRRYGFHGLAHESMWQGWRTHHPQSGDDGRVISLQLGSGCSVTAIYNGRAVDTSMGFSPLEGLVMGTRSGDIDPGLLLFLQRMHGITADQLEHVLTRESGLLGLSGTTADMQQLLATTDPRARLAIDVYCYRARKYIGAYLAVLGGAEAIVFGGGVGEHAVLVRAKILHGLEDLGICLDEDANRAAIGREACISRADSQVELWVMPVDEERVMAEQTWAAVAQ